MIENKLTPAAALGKTAISSANVNNALHKLAGKKTVLAEDEVQSPSIEVELAIDLLEIQVGDPILLAQAAATSATDASTVAGAATSGAEAAAAGATGGSATGAATGAGAGTGGASAATATGIATSTLVYGGLIGGGLIAAAGGGGGSDTPAPPPAGPDITAPTLTITDSATGITKGAITYTFTFNESVTGFTANDITVTGGTKGTFSGSGSVYTLVVTPDTNFEGNVTVNVAAGVAADAANNGNSAAIQSVQAVDTLVPAQVVTISAVVDNAGFVTGTVANSGTTDDITPSITGTLSAVLGAGEVVAVYRGGVKIGDATATATATASGTTWSYADSGLANSSSYSYTARVEDAAGNQGSASSAYGITINTAAPAQATNILTVADDVAPQIGNVASGSGSNDVAPVLSGTLLTGLAGSQVVAIYRDAVKIGEATVSGTTWTFADNGLTDGSHSYVARVEVSTGDATLVGQASNPHLITTDTAVPTVGVVLADSALKAGETSLVTFTFSEAVTGFTNADVTVAGGTLSAVASSDGGTTYTATFTPTTALTDATNVITVDKTGVADTSGNAGVGSTASANYAIDTAIPTVGIVIADTALKAGETSLVTFTFSEAVTGFTTADVTVEGGALGAVTSGDGGVTWTSTFTPTASLTDATNLITVDKTGVADPSGNAGVGTTASVNYAIDTALPTVSIVLADTALKAGETSLVTFTFSETVTGFTNADVTVEGGTLTAVATSDSGLTYTATFTPTADLADATNVVTVNKAGVADAAGNAGVGSTSSANYAIDTAAPTVGIVLADSALKVGETSLVTFTFSEAVTGFTNADVTIEGGTLSAVASSDGGTTYTATFTPTVALTDATNLITVNKTGVADVAGNAGVGATASANYAIDTVIPTVGIVVADTALKAGETSLVTFTFSEAVTGFTTADVTVEGGTLGAVASGDGGVTWTGTFTPTASLTDATNLITVDKTGVADLAGNAGVGTTASANYAIDTALPTVGIVFADSALKIGETSLVTFTFSEAVSGFSNADITIEGGTLTAVATSDGGLTYTATFTPTAALTDASNVITVNTSGVADLAGNTGAGPTASANYAVDTVRPTVGTVLADTALRSGETSLVTFTFSEVVTGFTNADVTVEGGTLSAVNSSDGGLTWTATFTPTALLTDASNVITVDQAGVADTAGNAGTGTAASANYTVDTTMPTVGIVLADSALKVGETSLVTFTFSEAVTGFANADVTIEGGTLTAVSSSDGGVIWTATFTPTAALTDATNVISVDTTGVLDADSNPGVGTTSSANYAIDTVIPTGVGIVIADTALKAGETSLVTFTFSEAMTNFTNADITVEGGTLGAVSSSDGGTTWTATFTPSAALTDGSNVITVAMAGVTDIAGNAAVGTLTSANYAIDTAIPTVGVVFADSALKAGETSLVTFTFSEAVTGFTNGDITIDGGTLSAVSSGDGGTTYTATFTPTADLTDASNLITVNKTGVADAAGNAGVGNTASANYAIDTAIPTVGVVLADSALKAGETSLVTFTFSEAVIGFTNVDVTVDGGTLSAVGSGDGGITYTATFTPTADLTDATNLITVNKTGVTDAASNVGVGSTSSANYAIDTAIPTVGVVLADSALKAGETSLVTFTFSEAVTGFTNVDVTVDGGTLSAVGSSDGGTTYTATFTPTADLTDATNLITVNKTGVADAASNVGVGSTSSANYAIDTAIPTVSVAFADSALKAGETSLVTFTFSEVVTGFTNADLTIEGGTLSAVSSSDGGTTYTTTFTPTADLTDATNVITVNKTGIADTSTNAGVGSTSSANYAIDTAIPAQIVTITGLADDLAPTLGNVASGGTTNDTTPLWSGTLSAGLAGGEVLAIYRQGNKIGEANVIGTNWTYADSVGNGNYTYTARVEDAAGNLGSFSADYDVIIDSPAPTVAITDDEAGTGNIPGGDIVYTITFSEGVTGFTADDITVTGGTKGALSGSGAVYTLPVTPAVGVEGDITVSVNAGVANAISSGLGNLAATPTVQTVDTIAPTVSITDDEAGTGNIAGGDITYTFTFSQPVTGFTAGDITVANGAKGVFAGAGDTYTLIVTPTAGFTGNVTVDVPAGGAFDANNNGNIVATQSVQTVDMLAPSAPVISVVAGNDVISGSETGSLITGTAAANATVNLTLGAGNFQTTAANGAGSWSYTLTASDITAMGQGAEILSATATDGAGNTGPAGTRAITVDSLAPTQFASINNISDNSGAILGNISNGGITDDTTPTLTGNVSFSLGGDEVVAVYRNGVKVGDATDTGGNNWSFTDSGLSYTNAYNYTVRVEDAAGNVGNLSSGFGIVATNAPSFTQTSFTVSEGESWVGISSAVDPNGLPVSYRVTGGADADQVLVEARTFLDGFGNPVDYAQLYFKPSIQFEANRIADADGDGVYQVEVTSSNGTQETAQMLNLTVLNTAEVTTYAINVAGNNLQLTFDQNLSLFNSGTNISVQRLTGTTLGADIATTASASGSVLTINTTSAIASTDVLVVKLNGDVSNAGFSQPIIFAFNVDNTIDLEALNDAGLNLFGATLFGGSGNDTLLSNGGGGSMMAGAGSDTIISGWGKDQIFVGNEASPVKDTIVIDNAENSGASNLTSYDTVFGFDASSATTANHDVLSLQSRQILGNVTNADGIDAGSIARHTVANGIVSFLDAAGNALAVTNSATLDDAFNYLDQNVSVNGQVVAFAYDSDGLNGADSTFVFQESAYDDESSMLVKLNGVTGATLGNAAGAGVIEIADTAAPQVNGLGFTTGALGSIQMSYVEAMAAPGTITNAPVMLKNGTDAMTITGTSASNNIVTLNTNTALTSTDWVKMTLSSAQTPFSDLAGNQEILTATVDDPSGRNWTVGVGGTGNTTIDFSAEAIDKFYIIIDEGLGGGNDTLTGSNFSDFIGAGAGNDSISSGNGDDEINGGSGADTINGGAGADSYRFLQGDSSTITGFTDGDSNGLDDGDTFTFAGGATDVIAGSGFTVSGDQGDRIEIAFDNSPLQPRMDAPPNGLVDDQGFFLVRGDYNAGVFTADTIAGSDTLVVYDGAAGYGSVLQTGLVIDSINPTQLTVQDWGSIYLT